MATESNSQPRAGSADSSPGTRGDTDARATAYWRANLTLVGALLAIWFLVSFGFGILLVEPLNQFTAFGFKLGFWWAQQGSIYVFIALIFVYAAAMRRIDRHFDVHEQDEAVAPDSPDTRED